MRISRFADPTGTVYRFLIALLIYMIGGFPTLVYALPQGGTIASGAGTIDTSGSALTVTQTTNKIIINWESFSIGNNESVIFLQPDSTSSALNNVLGTSRTVVEGNLLANGQIVLSNPNGIFLSPNANIDVAGLIASTLKISEQDFLDGLYKFSQDSSKPLASILNEGKIRASDFAALIAPSVDNKGVVIANLGTVGLVSGKAATVDFVGDNLIKFTVNAPVEGQVLDKNGNLISDRISNSGSIQANGGQVILSAKNASSIIQDVINVEGLITAKTVTKKNGLIVISGGNQGTVRVAGTLNASGEESGEQGGEITIEGADVIVARGSIQAKGTDAKGGNITITGTDWVNAGSTMDVSGKTGGNVNITTGGLSLSAPVLAKGTTGQGGNINIKTLFKSWEVVSAMLDVSGASGGTIKHFADQQITTSGKYLAIGTDGTGGSIDVTANNLRFLSNTIDASGTMGGGRVRVGGEYQGGKNLATDEIKNAKVLFMTDAANITARTTGTDGDGGRIIAWGDRDALVLGNFDVRPGTHSGAGGFVEISSGDTLTFLGSVKTGMGDRAGTLLLDPKNITIADTTVYDANSYMIGKDYDITYDIDETNLTDANGDELYGNDVTLDGKWLAVGHPYGHSGSADGDHNRTGNVYLYSYSNDAFSGGLLRAIIGDERTTSTGGTTYTVDQEDKVITAASAGTADTTGTAFVLDSTDHFGNSVSLHGGRLAVGARKADGHPDNNLNQSGEVYLFTFNDDVSLFAGVTLQAVIGSGYTTTIGSKNIDLSNSVTNPTPGDSKAAGRVDIKGADEFGQSVSLSEGEDGSTRLAVGCWKCDGYNDDATLSGEVFLFTFADSANKDFTGGELAAMVGSGYDNSYSGDDPRGGKDIGDSTFSAFLQDSGDSLGAEYFGTDVDLYYDSSLDVHRLAVVSRDDSGLNNDDNNNGAVFLFSFTDDDFSGGTHEATIGSDYSGGKNENLDMGVNETRALVSVSIDDNYLALGAKLADGFNDDKNQSG